MSVNNKFINSNIRLVLILIFLLIAGCNTNEDSKLERNKEIILRMNEEVWNNATFELIDQFYSEDFVWHFLPSGSSISGLDNLRKHVINHKQAFPDWKEEIKHIVAEGDLVVIHFESTGINRGSFLGNEPTGKSIKINEVSIFRIEDEKITEQWLLPDLLSLNQQLGLISETD